MMWILLINLFSGEKEKKSWKRILWSLQVLFLSLAPLISFNLTHTGKHLLSLSHRAAGLELLAASCTELPVFTGFRQADVWGYEGYGRNSACILWIKLCPPNINNYFSSYFHRWECDIIMPQSIHRTIHHIIKFSCCRLAPYWLSLQLCAVNEKRSLCGPFHQPIFTLHTCQHSHKEITLIIAVINVNNYWQRHRMEGTLDKRFSFILSSRFLEDASFPLLKSPVNAP